MSSSRYLPPNQPTASAGHGDFIFLCKTAHLLFALHSLPAALCCEPSIVDGWKTAEQSVDGR